MKKIIIPQKLSDEEIEKFCELHNINLIMVGYDQATSTTTITGVEAQ
jgi:hypothetical protein